MSDVLVNVGDEIAESEMEENISSIAFKPCVSRDADGSLRVKDVGLPADRVEKKALVLETAAVAPVITSPASIN